MYVCNDTEYNEHIYTDTYRMNTYTQTHTVYNEHMYTDTYTMNTCTQAHIQIQWTHIVE